jgi:hypothetical protein
LTVEQLAGRGTNYLFTFTKPLERPSATYLVETSSDLVTWLSAPDTLVSNTETSELRRATIEVPPDTPQLFLRLRMNIAP